MHTNVVRISTMNTYRKTSIIVGVLFIMGFTGILSTVLVKSITDDPNYLVKVSENENKVLIGALSELIMAFHVPVLQFGCIQS